MGVFYVKTIKYELNKQVVDEIGMNIQNEVYKLENKIPAEPELLSQYIVSRNTIREAVQALTHARLLEARQGDETYVVLKSQLKVDFISLMKKTNREEIIVLWNLVEGHMTISATMNTTS